VVVTDGVVTTGFSGVVTGACVTVVVTDGGVSTGACSTVVVGFCTGGGSTVVTTGGS
jgi:hypothetical protein